MSTLPLLLFSSSLLLSLLGAFCLLFKFSLFSVVFSSLEKKYLFHNYPTKMCVVRNAIVFWYTFTGYWLCFSFLWTLQLCCVRVNTKQQYSLIYRYSLKRHFQIFIFFTMVLLHYALNVLWMGFIRNEILLLVLQSSVCVGVKHFSREIWIYRTVMLTNGSHKTSPLVLNVDKAFAQQYLC
jgi:hypothetical protein